jgi:N-acetylneuraminic acid mutarotase
MKTKKTLDQRTSQVTRRKKRHSLIAGPFPVVSILVRRIAFPLLLLGAGLMLVQPSAGQSGSWLTTGSLLTARYAHTATLLPDGKVLAAGGFKHYYLSSAELYDPASGTWTATGSLLAAPNYYTATLLPNGKVLAAGGFDNGYLSSAELYDPASGTWTATGSLATARYAHTATLLPNGKVLVVGGVHFDDLASAELYDPASETWTATGSLATARAFHTATLLPNGKVLAAGGLNATDGYLASAELYDPASGIWSATGSLATARYAHTATLLPNSKVIVAGGGGGPDPPYVVSSAELYDPATGTWMHAGSLATGRLRHTATLLPNGKVLAAGGLNLTYLSSAELYDPATGTWTATGSLNRGRYVHTATLLPNGKVLATGGTTNGIHPLASAELYASDGGGELTLVSAASRKKHGNAGTFDIDLPLTGTPGVECRVGNGGTFLQTIVFTFSEPVTSVSGTTSTTCGRVNSAMISGSTVTVELGHVTCDGSDITVTVPGVNGASGSVDASATITLRTGDVNADGVVGTADLKEIRMNVGRGLVNDDNFRDDITVDGKVNHGDTTLEKSKL